METIKIAAISVCSTANRTVNIDNACLAVKEAAQNGAQWVQLPEMLCFLGDYSQIYDMAEDEGGPIYQKFSQLARDLGIVLFAGTMGERPPKKRQQISAAGYKKVFNTAYVFGRDGSQITKYRKTHLFNLLNEDGSRQYCESDGYIAGDEHCVFEVDGFNVGLAVCYDLRFPSFFARMHAIKPFDVLALPSAFTAKTGEAHWELLLKARAVEWQCYVFAANQTGQHSSDKQSWGQSMVVDPWGSVLSETKRKPEIAYATISKSQIAEVRQKLPALSNRIPALY